MPIVGNNVTENKVKKVKTNFKNSKNYNGTEMTLQHQQKIAHFQANNQQSLIAQQKQLVSRKPVRIAPLSESNLNIIQQNCTQFKGKYTENMLKSSRSQSSANAVARRNARERNRVKLVNDAFDTLRDLIPEDIFDVKTNNNRAAVKKFNKVQTLNMAAKYIMMMKIVLESEQANDTMTHDLPTSSDNSKCLMEDQASVITMTTPPPEESASTDYEDEEIGSDQTSGGSGEVTVFNGRQYIRIAGTNTYQDITNMYDNVENVHPTVLVSHPQHSDYSKQILDSTTGYLHSPSIHTPASLSPAAYNEQSLSPAGLHHISDIKQEKHCFRASMAGYQPPNSPPSSICESVAESVCTVMSDPMSVMSSDTRPTNVQFLSRQYEGIINLKTEYHDSEMLLQEQPVLMMDQVDWWNHSHQAISAIH